MQGISIVIPTLNGGRIFEESLLGIRAQDFEGPVDLLVVDSGSTDGTPAAAERAGARVIRIPNRSFHHARTRNLALKHTIYEDVVFMVQDAIPVGNLWLNHLRSVLRETGAAAVYGRQIAHASAGPYARWTTEGLNRFLGPDRRLQSLASPDAYAEMTFDEAYRVTRLDNVCALYRKKLLLLHPFPEVPYAEDMAWAKEILFAGERICYDPDVVVRHSHDRPADYVFRRHVVDSVFCGRILGKLRNDFSGLSVSDLIDVSHGVESRVKGLMGGDFRSQGKHLESGGLFPYLYARFSFRNTCRRFLLRGLRRLRGGAGFSRGDVLGKALAEVDYHWRSMRESLPPLREAEAWDALQKLAAGVLGKWYGDTYAAQAARGVLKTDLQRFTRPYLSGI